jgi:hypothetical protein
VTCFTVLTALAAAGLARFGGAVAALAAAGLRTSFAGALALALLRLAGAGSPVAFLVVTMGVPELQTEDGS